MIPPERTPTDRARVHIKALIDETKHQATNAPLPVQTFLSGMLSGLAASVEILNGETAEKSMELMAQRLAAAIGQAYLDGKLPPTPPSEEDQAAEEPRRTARRASIHERLNQLAHRGILAASAAELLRNQVEAEMREADTARAVAAGNLRHVRILIPELEQAQAAVGRVRALAADMHTWCSPHGVATDYAKRIEDALDAPVTTPVTSVNADPGGWKTADHVGHGTPCEKQADGSCSSPGAPTLRDQIAAALYERERPPRDPAWADAYPADREVFEAMADAVLTVILPTTRLLGDLHRSAHEDLARVIDLYERWCKAGPPPLGTSISRWWDERLLELRHAVVAEPGEAPS